MKIVNVGSQKWRLVAVPSDHEHDFQLHLLGGDFTCVICNIAASDSWEVVTETISGGE